MTIISIAFWIFVLYTWSLVIYAIVTWRQKDPPTEEDDDDGGIPPIGPSMGPEEPDWDRWLEMELESDPEFSAR